MWRRLFCTAVACSTAFLVPATAQTAKTFKARLAPVPIDVSMQATIAGKGVVTATLTGTKLSLNGTFEGLRSPATIAQVHRGPIAGVRGPVLFDLLAAKDASGTISGSADLTAAQISDLQKGRLYVQLHSEKAPEGNLWGWLMPEETKR